MKLQLGELKQRPGERPVEEEALATLPDLLEQRRSTLLRFLLHSENLLIKLKATTLVPDSPKSSEAIEGSDYEPTPSCPTFGAAGAQDGSPELSTTRALRKCTFQKPVYSGYATDELEDGR